MVKAAVFGEARFAREVLDIDCHLHAAVGIAIDHFSRAATARAVVLTEEVLQFDLEGVQVGEIPAYQRPFRTVETTADLALSVVIEVVQLLGSPEQTAIGCVGPGRSFAVAVKSTEDRRKLFSVRCGIEDGLSPLLAREPFDLVSRTEDRSPALVGEHANALEECGSQFRFISLPHLLRKRWKLKEGKKRPQSPGWDLAQEMAKVEAHSALATFRALLRAPEHRGRIDRKSQNVRG